MTLATLSIYGHLPLIKLFESSSAICSTHGKQKGSVSATVELISEVNSIDPLNFPPQ
jgi:hypothetical protein